MAYKDRVKADRLARGMSQEKYAEFVGVSRQTIVNAERGTAGAVAKIAIRTATGVDYEERGERS